MNRENFGNRITVVALALILAFGGLTYRLIDLQMVDADFYAEMARKQRLEMTSIQPRRGSLLDRSGQILAFSKEVYSIYATPYQVKDPESTAAQLSVSLRIPQNQLLDKLRSNSGFVYLQRKVEKDVADSVQSLNLPGIGLIKESKRCYPQESLAAQAIGYVGMDNVGLAGIELQYEDVLAGTPGEVIMERDPTGEPIPGMSEVKVPPRAGSDLMLSLDLEIQYKAEQELAKAVESSGSKSGNLVVMDCRNGEILAMATCPGFDLNAFPDTAPALTRNRAVTDIFEPGSVLKVVAAAAALGEKVVSPSTSLYVPPQIQIGDAVFKDDHPLPGGQMTFTEIIARSSNVGTIRVAQMLGKDRLLQYLQLLGCGRTTGVDFPGEATGMLLKPSLWTATSTATLAIGQGVAVTTLQLARIMAAVANGGVMVKPHFLLKTIDSEGEEEGYQVEEERVLDEETAHQLTGILEEVVRCGTGTRASMNLYNAAGKTGTAMKPDPHGGYRKAYMATFAGFAPSEDPRLVMVVTLDEPTPIYGGVVAAPCFSQVMEFALQRLQVPPSRNKINTRDVVKPE